MTSVFTTNIKSIIDRINSLLLYKTTTYIHSTVQRKETAPEKEQLIPILGATSNSDDNVKKPDNVKKTERLVSLDATRGAVVMLMMCVHFNFFHFKVPDHTGKRFKSEQIPMSMFALLLGASVEYGLAGMLSRDKSRFAWDSMLTIAVRVARLYALAMEDGLNNGPSNLSWYRMAVIVTIFLVKDRNCSILVLILARMRYVLLPGGPTNNGMLVRLAVYYFYTATLRLMSLRMGFRSPMLSWILGFLSLAVPYGLIVHGYSVCQMNESLAINATTNCGKRLDDGLTYLGITNNSSSLRWFARKVWPMGNSNITGFFFSTMGLQMAIILRSAHTKPFRKVAHLLCLALVTFVAYQLFCTWLPSSLTIPFRRNDRSVTFTLAHTSFGLLVFTCFYVILDVAQKRWRGDPFTSVGWFSGLAQQTKYKHFAFWIVLSVVLDRKKIYLTA